MLTFIHDDKIDPLFVNRLNCILKYDWQDFLINKGVKDLKSLQCHIRGSSGDVIKSTMGNNTIYLEIPLNIAQKVLGMQEGISRGNSLVLFPTLMALISHGAFDHPNEKILIQKFLTRQLSDKSYKRFGRVWGAFKTLELEGWLELQGSGENTYYKLTDEGYNLLELVKVNLPVAQQVIAGMHVLSQLHTLFRVNPIKRDALSTYRGLVEQHRRQWNINDTMTRSSKKASKRFKELLDGMLLCPTLVALAMPVHEEKGTKLNISSAALIDCDASSLHGMKINFLNDHNPDFLYSALKLIEHVGWVNKREDDSYMLTKEGSIAFQLTTPVAALVGSYMKTYSKLPQHLFDTESQMGIRTDAHIDRIMNVFGTSRASSVPAIDHLCVTHLRDIFDLLPLNEQPIGIADIGCGDGRALDAMVSFILQSTARGRAVKEYPLVVIGADFNEGPLSKTKVQLTKYNKIEGVKVRVVQADVTNPDAYDRSVKELRLLRSAKGLDSFVELSDFVHTFMFLIHNRRIVIDSDESAREILLNQLQIPKIREQAEKVIIQHFNKSINFDMNLNKFLSVLEQCFPSTYVKEEGIAVSGLIVAADLVTFLDRWRPYSSYGLISIEGHVPTYIGTLNDKIPYPQPHTFRWGMHYISEQYLLSFREYLLAFTIAGYFFENRHGYGRLYPSGFPIMTDQSSIYRPRSVSRAIPTY